VSIASLDHAVGNKRDRCIGDGFRLGVLRIRADAQQQPVFKLHFAAIEVRCDLAGIGEDDAPVGIEARTSGGDEAAAGAAHYGTIQIGEQGCGTAVRFVGHAAENDGHQHRGV
jgi:hypothetical protein